MELWYGNEAISMLPGGPRRRSGRTIAEQIAGVAVTAGCIAAASVFQRARRLKRQVQVLQAQLEREGNNRASERAGRIRAEQALRQLRALHLTAAPGPAASSDGATPAASDEISLPRGVLSETPPAVTTAAAAGGTTAPAAEGIACRTDSTASASSSALTSAVARQNRHIPFTPIGYAVSCFSQRNGTPRQPLLVPAARLRVRLSCPPEALEGLELWSHVWVLYVFHENTDLAKSLGGGVPSAVTRASTYKAKVRVPRLDGQTMGVLATRTPHRPCPIGLSVAQVVSVCIKKGILVLGGADIVNGSPILDIKPYVPFADALPQAVAPPWVQAEKEDDEPLHIAAVNIPSRAKEQLHRAWSRIKDSMYPSAAEFLELIEQVLARDIRSVHQRRNNANKVAAEGGSAELEPESQQQGRFHVVLEGVDIHYDIDTSGTVWVRGVAT